MSQAPLGPSLKNGNSMSENPARTDPPLRLEIFAMLAEVS